MGFGGSLPRALDFTATQLMAGLGEAPLHMIATSVDDLMLVAAISISRLECIAPFLGLLWYVRL